MIYTVKTKTKTLITTEDIFEATKIYYEAIKKYNYVKLRMIHKYVKPRIA